MNMLFEIVRLNCCQPRWLFSVSSSWVNDINDWKPMAENEIAR